MNRVAPLRRTANASSDLPQGVRVDLRVEHVGAGRRVLTRGELAAVRSGQPVPAYVVVTLEALASNGPSRMNGSLRLVGPPVDSPEGQAMLRDFVPGSRWQLVLFPPGQGAKPSAQAFDAFRKLGAAHKVEATHGDAPHAEG